MSENAKPCPFCGRAPKIKAKTAHGSRHVAYAVCYCGGYHATAYQRQEAATEQAALEAVIAAWNAQPPEAP